MIQSENEVVDPYLRSQGNCIIVAASKSRNSPVGFIRYSFLWHKLNIPTCPSSGLNNSSSKHLQTSELIIRVKNLREVDLCREDNSASTITLLTLALEHARRLNIWYGTLDSANVQCSAFFSKYFRMNHVHALLGGNIAVTENTMFVNLHRLNFNYTAALWVEERRQSKPENPLRPQTERMIVRLGNCQTSDIIANHRINNGLSRVLHQSVSEQSQSAINVRLTYKTDDSADISIQYLPSANVTLEKDPITDISITGFMEQL